jgi:hypothetical protein
MKEGDALTPLLFNFALEEATRMVQEMHWAVADMRNIPVD